MGGYTDSEGFITLNKKVELKPYRPRTFKDRLYLTDNEILSFTKHPAFINVEVYPNYFLLTVKINGKFLNIECGNNLSFNPKFLSWLLFNYKTVGFNSIKYDLLMIWLAYYNQNTNTIKSASNDLILNNMRDHELKKEYKFLTHVTSHVDLLEVAPLKGSLKLYGARLHTESIQEQPFDVDKELSDFEIEELKKFNCNQLDITEQLFDFMKERLDLRESLGNEYHENLMSKSDAQIAEVILVKEVAKLNGKRPSRNDVESGTVFRYSVPHYINYQTPELKKLLERIRMAKFTVQPSGKMDIPEEVTGAVKVNNGYYRIGIGGLHSSEKTVAYKSDDKATLVDRDVASYYPRLITTLGLYPTSCGPNFLVAFEKLILGRLEDKRKAAIVKKQIDELEKQLSELNG